MSPEVTEPKSWSFSPVLRVKRTLTPLMSAACFCAASSSVAVFLASGGANALEGFHVAAGGFDGELVRQQEIAGVAGLDDDDVAAVAEFFDVFLQNDLHGVSLCSCR